MSSSWPGRRGPVTADGLFLAEGLFAPDIVSACRVAGVLDDAICLRRPRLVTFVLRLVRDLREGRKAPWVLVRRGWRLLQADPAVVEAAVAAGCRPVLDPVTDDVLSHEYTGRYAPEILTKR